MFMRKSSDEGNERVPLSQAAQAVRTITRVVLGVVGVLAVTILAFGLVENLDASEVMVIQNPITGNLAVYTEPGPAPQWFGAVTKYKRREQYSFSSAKDVGSNANQAIKTGFNDGGTGYVSGVVSWEMPLNHEAIIRLHKEYHGFAAIDQQLVRPMLEKVIFSAGATMSSIESSSERRPEIPQLIDDQLQNGPYLTKVVMQNVKDPLSGDMKTVRVVQIQTDDKTGKPIRASASTIKEYGITLSPVTVNDIDYEATVKNQIAERQKSTQAVQLSVAAAVRATQDAITAAKEGEAVAAKEKWKQEAINAKDIASAERDVKVQQLQTQKAELYKKQQILEGEGDAEKKRLVMAADGALDQKLAAWVKAQGFWADAFKGHQGPMVPQIQMGNAAGNGTTAAGSAQAVMDLVATKMAKDLSLDMHNTGTTTKK